MLFSVSDLRERRREKRCRPRRKSLPPANPPAEAFLFLRHQLCPRHAAAAGKYQLPFRHKLIEIIESRNLTT